MPTPTSLLPGVLLQGIAAGMYPATLWKYRPNNSFTDDIFLSKALYFPYPTQLNDPFDCQIQPVTCTTAQVKAFVQLQNPAASNSDKKRIVGAATKNPAIFRDMVNDTMRTHINQLGVCSFTTNHDHPLMWAHYTESHKGLCLQFDVTKDPALFITPLKVGYVPTYPVYNHLTDSALLAEKVLAVKSDHWNYEEEVRVIKRPLAANQKEAFNPLALTQVLFGCNMTANERKRIKTLAVTNGFGHVVFKKAVISPTSYAITFVPC